MPGEGRLIQPHGGYRKLRSFQSAQLVYDATVVFCDRFAEVAANTLICLINQASFLLGRQMQKLEQEFPEKGGFTERLYRERQTHKRKP